MVEAVLKAMRVFVLAQDLSLLLLVLANRTCYALVPLTLFEWMLKEKLSR